MADYDWGLTYSSPPSVYSLDRRVTELEKKMADYNPNQFEPMLGPDSSRRIATPEPAKQKRKCPTGGALIIKGEHFFCDFMDQMHESCDTHEGWPHASRAAEAIWQ